MYVFILTALLHSGHKAGQRDLWGQLDHWRRRRRSHRHWSGNTQTSRGSSRETEWWEVVDREKHNDKRKHHRREKKQNGKRERGKKENKKLVSKRNSAGSIAEQLIYTFPIRVLLCCVFQAALKRHSSHLSLRIYLISICFKSNAKAVGSSRFLLQWKRYKALHKLPQKITATRWHNGIT